MKKILSILISAILLLSCMLPCIPQVEATAKSNESRAIAIVFDNSGSMYQSGNQAWCRATYAMEVFASMLNSGDVLQIYPMWPITVGSQTYTMDDPFEITDSAQASKIREIFSPNANGTPIESIDSAVKGLQGINADKKYMIVLTDGGTFSKNGSGLTKERTKKELDDRIEMYAGAEMSIMYLGIGSAACMPDSPESDCFVKKQAVNTEDVLSTLTIMCNQIFGRDTLPRNRISGNSIEFDVSMKKLIVFVQGDNISDLKLTGSATGKLVGTQQTKYSTLGAGDYNSVADTSLQGMMVTYSDFASGTYNIEYTGTATSIEVYYEPNADLDFVFTDSEGNTVDPQYLYEGDYKVSFGMKDAKTGNLISSDLLGNPTYKGSYFIDGQEYPITHQGFSGSVDIPLKMGEKFEANLTVTYLSGYTISKNSSDFGWPEGGIQVAARPAGEFRMEISGGDGTYSIQKLEEGSYYTCKLFYMGEQLTGSELEKVELKWEPETSNAEIKKTFADDHWQLSLHHKDPSSPLSTPCGECAVKIYSYYAVEGSTQAQTQADLIYSIKDLFLPIQIELVVPTNYLVIKELDDSKPIVAKLTLEGRPLTPEEFSTVQFQADCGSIAYELIPKESESSYHIKLLATDGIETGKHLITTSAEITDAYGRKTQSEGSTEITLGTLPVWVISLIIFLVLLILFIVIWIILHIKVLPKYLHTTRRLSSMNFDGDDVTQSTNFLAEIKKKGAKVQGQYAGKKFGVSMDVKPGRESYLYKPQKRRSAEVKVLSVKKFGSATIHEAMIGSAKYVFDEDTKKLVPAIPNQKPFLLTNGMMVKFSGTIQDAGMDKDFEVTSKLNFKKK